MKQFRRGIASVMAALMVVPCLGSSAFAAGVTFEGVEAQADAGAQVIRIEGRVSSGTSQTLTLSVREGERIVHLDQFENEADGSFAYVVPADIDEGDTFRVRLGGAGVETPYEFTVTASGEVQEDALSVSVRGTATAGQDQRVPYTFSFSGEDEGLGNVTVVFTVKGDQAGLFTTGIFDQGFNGFSKLAETTETLSDGSLRVKVTLAYQLGMDQTTAAADEMDMFSYVFRTAAALEGDLEVSVEQAIFTYADDSAMYYADVTGGPAVTHVSAMPYDVDGDGDFDQADITAAQGFYRVSEGDADWAKAKTADLDGDGVITVNDLVKLSYLWLDVLG